MATEGAMVSVMVTLLTLMSAEVVSTLPAESVALMVRVCAPLAKAAEFQEKENGEADEVVTTWVSTRNCTAVMVSPAAGVALPFTATVPATVEPAAGLVRVTVGGAVAG